MPSIKGAWSKIEPVLRKAAFVFLWIFIAFMGIFFALVLAIRTPWAQQKIVQKATHYISTKTGTVVQLDRLFITFSGNIQLEGLYAEDLQKDTLLYSRSLEADISFLPLLNSRLVLQQLDWNGVVAHIKRNEDSTFNFNFLIDAFASKEKKVPPTKVDSRDPFTFDIGNIHFSDIKGTYKDELIKLDTRLVLGDLLLDANDFDLETMHFDFRKLALKETNVYVRKDRVVSDEIEDTTKSVLPQFFVDQLQIENVHAFYESPLDSFFVKADLSHFVLTKSTLDLNKQQVDLGNTNLSNSTIQLGFAQSTKQENAKNTNAESAGFEWPEWKVTARNLYLHNNSFVMNTGKDSEEDMLFDPNHIGITGLNLQLSNVYFKKETLGMTLANLAFKDRSGFRLNKLGFTIALDNTSIDLKMFDVRTPHSFVSGAVKTTYKDVYAFIKNFDSAYFDLKIDSSSLSLQDVYTFFPDLKKDTLLQKIDRYPLQLSVQTKGRIIALEVNSLEASWGKGTRVSFAGKIKGLPHVDSLSYDIPRLNLATVKDDELLFIQESETFRLPGFIALKSSITGTLNDTQMKASLSIPEGKADLSARYSKKQSSEFEGNIVVSDLNILTLLPTSSVGLVAMQLDFKGSGDSLENMNATFESLFSTLEIKNYNYQGLSLNGDLKEKTTRAHIAYLDSNLNLLADAKVSLDTIKPSYELSVDLKGADFLALGYTKKNIRGRFKLNADFFGQPEKFKSHLSVTNGLLIKDEERYLVGPIIANAEADSLHTKMYINSDFLSLTATANADLVTLSNTMQAHVYSYFENKKTKSVDTLKNKDVVSEAHIAIRNTPLLRELILPDLKQMDSIRLDMKFNQAKKYLDFHLLAPKTEYGTSVLSNLNVDVETKLDRLSFNLTYDSLKAGPATIYKTALSGYFNYDSLTTQLSINNKLDSALIVFAGNTRFTGDSIFMHVDPDKLVFNTNPWKISRENSLLITPQRIVFKNFTFNNKEQTVSFTSYPDEFDRFKLELKNFQLATITSLINREKIPVQGVASGIVDFRHVFTNLGYDANLNVESFLVMDHPLGTLKLKTEHVDQINYDVDLSIKGGAVDLNLNGNYDASSTNPKLDVLLDVNKIKMSFIQSFTDSLLENSSGSLKASLRLQGDPKAPQYKGFLSFSNAYTKVKPLNANFKFSEERIRLDNEGIYFNRFSIKDEKGNSSTLSGTVGTKSYSNPTFDLSLVSSNFQLVNSTREDNDLYFGKVLMDVNMQIKGDLEEPHVNVKTRLNKGSKINIIVPESKLEVIDREGVVVFVNVKNPSDPLTRDGANHAKPVMTGIKLNALIEVDPETSFKIIIDERSGDFLEVQGEANLIFDIEPNGRMSMSGRYDLKQGQYGVSLYGVVKRNFTITPGGSITWSGSSPENAAMNLSASYAVKTSAYDLMIQQLSSADEVTKNRYRQVLPFDVFINIKGRLLRPEISFALDMPDKGKGALGGSVYSRIQQLNQEENELNTQVFALLVMNRFIPTGSGTGTSSGAAAKSSVSQILSSQLNNLSQKYVKFVDLNVDVNSYTDYQSGIGEERSDLNVNVQKKLFNDRVVVKVGSQVALEGEQQQNANGSTGNVLGDASLEYLLTSDGRYLITGFRKSEYGGAIDGQLVVTGISLVLNKEFDSFQEIWKREPEPAEDQKQEKQSEK